MTLRSRRRGRSADGAPTRSSVTRVGLTVLGCAIGVMGVAVGTGAATAAPLVVPITGSQAAAIAPLCPTAWSITAADARLAPLGVSRNAAVATCIQYFRSVTRLEKGVDEAPARGAAVPPGPDRRPVPPLQVRLVPRAAPPTGPSTVTVRVPVPAAPAPATGGSSSGGSSSGGSSSAGSADGGASVPIGDGAAADGAAVDPGTTPAPAVAPAPAPAEAAPLLTDPAPGAAAAPVPVAGGSGTVSDPSIRTAATATPGGTGAVLPLALVLGVIVLAAVLGIGLRYAVVHDRLPSMPWSRRRDPDLPEAADQPGDDAPTERFLSPAGFVNRWLDHDGRATAGGSSGPAVSLEKAGQHGPGDLGAGRPEREVEDMVGVGHHQ